MDKLKKRRICLNALGRVQFYMSISKYFQQNRAKFVNMLSKNQYKIFVEGTGTSLQENLLQC